MKTPPKNTDKIMMVRIPPRLAKRLRERKRITKLSYPAIIEFGLDATAGAKNKDASHGTL